MGEDWEEGSQCQGACGCSGPDTNVNEEDTQSEALAFNAIYVLSLLPHTLWCE